MSTTKQDIFKTLSIAGLKPVIKNDDLVYVYIDGKNNRESPVESEWMIEFRFNKEETLTDFYIEERLVGP